MSDDQKIAIPANLPDDCSAEQPPKDDAIFTPMPNIDDGAASPSVEAANPSPPLLDDIAHSACQLPLSLDEAKRLLPKVESGSSRANGVQNTNSYDKGIAAINFSLKKKRGKHAHQIPITKTVYEQTAMSDDQKIAIPANLPDDCSAEQPPKDDAIFTPMPNIDDGAASPPVEAANPSPPLLDDIAHSACQLPLSLDEAKRLLPKVESGSSRANGVQNTNSYDKGIAAINFSLKKKRGKHAHQIPITKTVYEQTAMSDDQKIAIPANLPDDCSAEQPPKDDAIFTPMPNIDDGAASPPVEAANPSSPLLDDIAHSACQLPLSLDEAKRLLPKVESGSSRANGVQNTNSYDKGIAAINFSLKKKRGKHAHQIPITKTVYEHTAMSDDQKIAIPANLPDDCSAEQPPKDDAIFTPMSNIEDGATSPPVEDANPPPPLLDDIAHPACQLPLPLDEAKRSVPKVELGSSRASGVQNTNIYDYGATVKKEMKRITADWVTVPFIYDDNEQAILFDCPKVGFDRGLEPDHIVAATKQDGKLMFLVAWKNTEEADLLESTEVLEKCPQLVAKFVEAGGS